MSDSQTIHPEPNETEVIAPTTKQPEVTITAKNNGPFRVEGPIKLVDAQGDAWNLEGKPAISLCRCGASANKPFCDGSHNKVGFQSQESPVKAL